ncbi:MAG TPA: hypothetical protein PKG88_03090 [Bacteroidales bacterium]|nr:hypothetical protein [Bacteroidales bacterium]HPS71344.1 hypothetical protein [Bacteroidales bacterium]
MNSKLKNILLLVSLLLLITFPLASQVLTYTDLLKEPVYTSIKKALENPDKVYRLKLKGSLHCDSLPDVIFQFRNLQELTITRAKIATLNHRITELQYLVYLDISSNRLVKLPEELCDLQFLQYLIINRNMIYELPDQMGKLTNLKLIDAWGNQFFKLPESMSNLKETLKMMDILQIPIKEEEYQVMKAMLPNTEILYTPVCPCVLDR